MRKKLTAGRKLHTEAELAQARTFGALWRALGDIRGLFELHEC